MTRSTLFICLGITIICLNPAFSQWQQTSAPYDNVYTMQANNEVVLCSSGVAAFLRSTDHGQTWNPSGAGLTQLPLNDIISLPGTQIFYACSADYVYKSTDNGENWSVLAGSVALSNIRFLYYHEGTLFAGTGIGNSNYGLNRSTDDGQAWLHLTNGLTSQGVDCMNHDEMYIYAGLVGTGPGSSPGVFRSSDNGDSWEFASTGFETDIYDMATLDNKIFALFYATIDYSTDHGDSWNSTSGLTSSIPVVEIEPLREYLLACQLLGPYKLHKNSTQWEPWNEGLTSFTHQAFTSDEQFSYCGTSNAGIWKRSNDELVSIGETPGNEENGSWMIISPNPIITSAYIIINEEQLASVTLKVFDLQGRLAEEIRISAPSDNCHYHYDPWKLTPGIYFYTAIAGIKTSSGKLIVLGKNK